MIPLPHVEWKVKKYYFYPMLNGNKKYYVQMITLFQVIVNKDEDSHDMIIKIEW